MKLQFHNTLGGKKEVFVPLEPGKVRMYNCGPTVYNFAHIGNFRAFLLADLLRRTFEAAGYAVTQVMNLTDVGHLTEDDVDRIEVGARREKLDPWELTRRYAEAFFKDIETLGIVKAHHYPKATDHIPEMIEIVSRLLERGYAYATPQGVYFDVTRFPGYGRLSGNTLEALQAGASERVAEREEKRHPHDFALWKKDPKHLMKWPSPWGEGFPGWHVECSAMSMRYLGQTLDVHTGGEDNVFPHHESEIAQSEGANGVPFVRYWLHTRYLLVEGKKMSKTEGNFYTVPWLVERGFTGREIRHALLAGHYRQQTSFSLDSLAASRQALERLAAFQRRLDHPDAPEDDPEVPGLADRSRAEFLDAIADDLDVPQAMARLFLLVAEMNRRRLGPGNVAYLKGILGAFDRILGILPPAPAGESVPKEVRELVERREKARRARDYGSADELRAQVAALGYTIEDTPQGPIVVRSR